MISPFGELLHTQSHDYEIEDYMKIGYIYRIWRGDMSYVGQTRQDPETRIRAHFKQGGCPRLSNAIRKYGADAFQHEILEADIPADALSEREIYWIQHFNSEFGVTQRLQSHPQR